MDLPKDKSDRTHQRINLNNSGTDRTNDLYLHIVQTFGCIETTATENATKLLMLGDVEVEISASSVSIEWTQNSMISQTLADSIVTVSYTHLDVYKRQAIGMAIIVVRLLP